MVVGQNRLRNLCQPRWNPSPRPRHTVFGQLADEASYAVLDAIAAVETGAMDNKPVEDVVIETIEIED